MWKVVMPCLAMIAVTYALARFSFGLFLPDLSASMGLTEKTAGTIGSFAYVAYSLALLTSVLLVRRFGPLHVIQISGATAVVGMVGIAFSHSFYSLAISTFIAGLGSGWSSPAVSQAVTLALAEQHRDKGNAWINSGTSFGIVFTGPVALLFTQYWRLAYGLFAIIGLAVIGWCALCLPKKKGIAQDSSTPMTWKQTLWHARYLVLVSLLVGGISSIFWTFSRSYIAAIHHMNTTESAVFWIIMGASGIVGGLAGGMIKKIGQLLSYRLSLVMLLSSIAVLLIPSGVGVYPSAVLFGVSYIMVTGLFIIWASRVFPTGPALGVSLSFLAMGLGQTAGSLLGGGLIERTSYPFSFAMFAIVGLIGFIIPTNHPSIGQKRS